MAAGFAARTKAFASTHWLDHDLAVFFRTLVEGADGCGRRNAKQALGFPSERFGGRIEMPAFTAGFFFVFKGWFFHKLVAVFSNNPRR